MSSDDPLKLPALPRISNKNWTKGQLDDIRSMWDDLFRCQSITQNTIINRGSILDFVRDSPYYRAPVDSDFTWENQGGAVITTGNFPGILLYAPFSSGSDNLRIRKMAAPAGSYLVTAAFRHLLEFSNYSGGGLLMRDTTINPNRIIDWSYHYNTGDTFDLERRPNSNGFDSGVHSKRFWNIPPVVWLQMAYDSGSGDKQFRLSIDGWNFVDIGTAMTGGDWIATPDEIGWFATASGCDVNLTLLSWQVAT